MLREDNATESKLSSGEEENNRRKRNDQLLAAVTSSSSDENKYNELVRESQDAGLELKVLFTSIFSRSLQVHENKLRL